MSGFLVLGFLLGMRHALEADHLAAVAVLAARSRTAGQALLQGAAWGLGHTITLFLACSVLLFMDTAVPERLAQLLEAAVGAMLILLGADLLRRLWRERIHFHTHRHADGTVHCHAHSHPETGAHPQLHCHEHQRGFPARALYVGLMHGLAGSAALILMAIGTEQSPLAGLGYVALFGIGSIGGMALLSLAISVPLRGARRFVRLHGALRFGVAILTVAIGASLIWQ